MAGPGKSGIGIKLEDGLGGSRKVSLDPSQPELTLDAQQQVDIGLGPAGKMFYGSEVSMSSAVTTENGIIRYKLSGEAGAFGGAELALPKTGTSYSETQGAGVQSSYSVALPEAAARGADLIRIDPLNPDSMPTGSVIKMDAGTYTTAESKLVLRHLAMQTKVRDENGVGMVVEKLDAERVRVAIGPTAAVEAYNGLGVDFEQFRMMLGRNDRLGSSELKSVEFDFAQAEGRAGYRAMLTKGNVPTQNGPGIAGLQTIQTVDYQSKTQLGGKLGPIELVLDGARNTGKSVLVSYPDGTADRSVALQYSGNIPMTMTQKFDASGNEQHDQRQYAFTIKADENIAQMLNVAQTGNIDHARQGPVKPGETVTLQYSAREMGALQGLAEKSLATSGGMNHELRTLIRDYDDKPVSSEAFAIAMARNLGGNDYQAAERLYGIWLGSGGEKFDENTVALPGRMQIEDSSGRVRVVPSVEKPDGSIQSSASPGMVSLADAGHRDHAFYQSIQQQAASLGQTDERISYGLMAQAKANGIERADHVFLSRDGSQLMMMQGDPGDLHNRRIAAVDIAETIAKPMPDVLRELAESDQRQQARQQAENDDMQRRQTQEQSLTPRGP
ncbi:MAG: hypothetical protein Q4G62_07775 [Pseudomonadota bacterium]|nr:hypothetical protein [Pseudomonadota bacterium]